MTFADPVKEDGMQSIARVPAALNVLAVAVLVAGCGADSGEQTHVFGSCVIFDVQAGEVATYRFTDAASAATLVKISVAAINGPVVTMDIEQGATASRLNYNTACEDGSNAGLSMTPEVKHLLFGTGLPLAGTASAPGPAASPVPAPPPVPPLSRQCGPATVTTPAGTFAVQRCSTVYGAGDLYRTSEEDAIEYGRPRPFSGLVKETIDYSDGSQRNVELLQWNGI